jgi:hypothetical protein
MPIQDHTGCTNSMRYIRKEVAFSHLHNRWISIQTGNGLIGWNDGTTVKPSQ